MLLLSNCNFLSATLLLFSVRTMSAFRFSHMAKNIVLPMSSASSKAVTMHQRSILPRMFSGAPQEVSAALVKELREKSGAPMMDCKKALIAEGVNGDISKAIDFLRTKGLAKAQSNDRVAAQGLVGIYAHANGYTLVEVNCETDFVNNNRLFQDFVGTVAATASGLGKGNVDISQLMNSKCSAIGNGVAKQGVVRDALGDAVTSIRENIVVKRGFNIEKVPDSVIGFYVHGKVLYDLPNNSAVVAFGQQLGVVCVSANGLSDSKSSSVEIVAKKLAMHVVAAKPSFLNREDVPKDVIEKETTISREQSAAQSVGKKPEMVEKMIAGKVSKRLSEICLIDQNHMAEEGSPQISKYLVTAGSSLGLSLKIEKYYRWSVGQLI